MVHDDTYHVTSRQHYHVQKRSDDATPAATSPGSNLIIYRDSDLYRAASFSRKKRGLNTDKVVCGADNLLNKTAAYTEASSHSYYYPPDLTATVPMMGGFDMTSSWTDVLKSPMIKRDIAVKVAGPNPVPTGCPTNRLVNYMGVAADCAYVRSYGGQEAARKQIFADFNTASGIYESTFNVALGIITLNITSENCPATPVVGEEWNQDCSTAYTIAQRLSDFSFWRGQGGRSSDGAGLWHLMTKCNSGQVVGIAWTKALCQTKSQSQTTEGTLQYTAGTGVSSITPNEWMVVSHEVGHGFGAIHDCTSTTCPATDGQCCPLSATTCDAAAQYIMNPSEQTATRVFSPCSISTICTTIQSSSGQCLQSPGALSTQSSEENICGNGLKEAGEDCDCGSAEDCANDPCCDGTTCKFKGTAVCDDLNDDCCLNCQLRPAGQVCRQAISECDLQEVCSGTNATCPPDVQLPNLTSCQGTGNATGLQCADGLCTSRDLQCQQQGRTGINKQCGASTTCDLMCNDPDGSALTCMQIPGSYFVDGSPCGFGGTCSAGQCTYSSGIDSVLNWARSHLTIVIPVACLVGLILICCIWSCCCSGFIQRRRQRTIIQKPYYGAPPVGPQGGPGGPPVYETTTVQGARHMGQRYPVAPLPPPPVYPDASALARLRDDELQRALAESRQEYERQSRTLSGMGSAPPRQPSPGQSNSRNGATVVTIPSVSRLPSNGSGQSNSSDGRRRTDNNPFAD
ncbi:Metallo-peptidase family M12-domain-containing protein [Dissophora ornata]|nr:Metallo-peptidase family M12-domain-containing protein [Dissophora ornata]